MIKNKSLREGAHRKRNPAQTREGILDVARQVIGQGGKKRLRVTDVARRAGVQTSTVRRYFKTREKLIEATSESLNDDLYKAVYADIGSEPYHASGSARLRRSMKRLTTFAMENPGFGSMWLLERLKSPAPANDGFWNQFQLTFEEFAKTDRAQPGIDVEVSSVLILAGIFAWPVWAHSQEESAKERKLRADRFSRELLRLCLHGTLRPETHPKLGAVVWGAKNRGAARAP